LDGILSKCFLIHGVPFSGLFGVEEGDIRSLVNIHNRIYFTEEMYMEQLNSLNTKLSNRTLKILFRNDINTIDKLLSFANSKKIFLIVYEGLEGIVVTKF
jgi:hypothetical protein